MPIIGISVHFSTWAKSLVFNSIHFNSISFNTIMGTSIQLYRSAFNYHIKTNTTIYVVHMQACTPNAQACTPNAQACTVVISSPPHACLSCIQLQCGAGKFLVMTYSVIIVPTLDLLYLYCSVYYYCSKSLLILSLLQSTLINLHYVVYKTMNFHTDELAQIIMSKKLHPM